MVISQLGIALPAFWLSILLVLLFAVKLRWCRLEVFLAGKTLQMRYVP